MKNAPAAIAVAAILFATAGIARRLAPESITAAHFGVSRLLVGGVLLAALVGPRRMLRTFAALPRGPLAAAAAALALFQWCFFAGVSGAGVAVGTLVGAGASPMFADAIASLRARRTMSGLAALSAGLAVLAVSGLGLAVRGHGIAMALAAALSFAAYASIARDLERAAAGAGLATSAIALVAAGACLLPAAAVGAGALATPAGVALVLYLSVVTVAIAYRLFVPALREVSAAHALAILQLQPLASVIAGGLFLGEAVDAPIIAGAALLAAALAVRFFPTPLPKGSPHGHEA